MANKIRQIDALLRMALGDALVSCCPELAYTVHASLLRFLRAGASLPELLRQIDSAVFNAVYTGSQGTMIVTLGGGRRVRITGAFIHDLADRLLALAYDSLPVSPALRDALFDFSREGSFAAMRELVRRFPMDEADRAYYVTVLTENGQLS